jgi:hypothetical protein
VRGDEVLEVLSYLKLETGNLERIKYYVWKNNLFVDNATMDCLCILFFDIDYVLGYGLRTVEILMSAEIRV